MAAEDVKAFVVNDFRLKSGIVMPAVTIAYRTLGVLAPDRDNVVLVTHGNTSGPQMIDPGGSTGEGSRNGIVGPSKAVDTNDFPTSRSATSSQPSARCSITSASTGWSPSSGRPMADSRPFNGRSIIPA